MQGRRGVGTVFWRDYFLGMMFYGVGRFRARWKSDFTINFIGMWGGGIYYWKCHFLCFRVPAPPPPTPRLSLRTAVELKLGPCTLETSQMVSRHIQYVPTFVPRILFDSFTSYV